MGPDTTHTTVANEPAAARLPLDVGFYGKLPSHGDFLRRRVSDAFVGVWDGWLQECIASSQVALGDRWLDVYLTSPAWRFVCAAGACGPAPLLGLMVPSVDRVGRYFPLTLVAELPRGVGLLAAAAASAPFFEEAERIVIETLETEQVDFETFDERLMKLGYELGPAAGPGLVLDASAGAGVGGEPHGAWQVPIASARDLGAAFHQILGLRLSAACDPLVLWWTEGSSVVVPSCLVLQGLPHPEAFTALLDGAWGRRQWRSVPAYVDSGPADDTLVDDLTPPRFRSAAASNVGRVREINEDSFLERPDVGVWAVADGLGGHSDGEVASRMVCDALADLVANAGFEDLVEEARQRIAAVNDHLLRAATRAIDPVRSGSTVVALMARGSRCAVLWAGDSRAYRLRDGRIEPLTRDHSLGAADDGAGGRHVSHAITRAVGGEATLALDVYRGRVRPGDRFLLCSDGLTRVVREAEIRGWMEHPDPRVAVEGLVRATLDGGAPDNVTVLLVEAFT